MCNNEPRRIVCERCGSENIVSDATAEWCVSTQSWSLAGVQDENTCTRCDKSCWGENVPIEYDPWSFPRETDRVTVRKVEDGFAVVYYPPRRAVLDSEILETFSDVTLANQAAEDFIADKRHGLLVKFEEDYP